MTPKTSPIPTATTAYIEPRASASTRACASGRLIRPSSSITDVPGSDPTAAVRDREGSDPYGLRKRYGHAAASSLSAKLGSDPTVAARDRTGSDPGHGRDGHGFLEGGGSREVGLGEALGIVGVGRRQVEPDAAVREHVRPVGE